MIMSRSSYSYSTISYICCVLICAFLSGISSFNDSHVSPEIITTTTTTPSITLTKCGDTYNVVDTCFKDLPPHLMEFLHGPRVALTEEDIVDKCTVFNRGMTCFDEYTTRCLTTEMIALYETNVEGARNFFNRFCNDDFFRRDYLRHKDCFAYIEKDWAHCTEAFQTILGKELYTGNHSSHEKFAAFCCARKAYENCIYNSARYKCYQKSAVFAHDTAKMLSNEKTFKDCRQYEDTFCARRENAAVKLNASPGRRIGLLMKCFVVVAICGLQFLFVARL